MSPPSNPRQLGLLLLRQLISPFTGKIHDSTSSLKGKIEKDKVELDII